MKPHKSSAGPGVGHKICCPVDFSEQSRVALMQAAALAARLDGEVVLVHAFLAPVYTLADGVVTGSPELLQQITDAVDKSLAMWAADGRKAHRGARFSCVALVGTPANAIVRHAKEAGCDLIVMGSHGRSGWKHLVLGSVAERVMRHADCPVMVVPSPQKEVAS